MIGSVMVNVHRENVNVVVLSDGSKVGFGLMENQQLLIQVVLNVMILNDDVATIRFRNLELE